MSRTPITKFRKAKGTWVEMNSHDYNMYMAFCILSLRPQYKWMLMSTPLVNGMEDLHWILCFLESSSGLTLQLLPDIYDNSLNIDDDCVTNRSTVSGTEWSVGFMQVADQSKNGPEFESLIYCTTIPSNTYFLPCIGEVENLRRATQISDIIIRLRCYKETNVMRSVAVLCPLMLPQLLVSHILFENPKPIINIPPMHVTTELVTFTKSFELDSSTLIW